MAPSRAESYGNSGHCGLLFGDSGHPDASGSIGYPDVLGNASCPDVFGETSCLMCSAMPADKNLEWIQWWLEVGTAAVN